MTVELTPAQQAALDAPGPLGYAVIASDGFKMTTPDRKVARSYEKAMRGAVVIPLVRDLAPLPEDVE